MVYIVNKTADSWLLSERYYQAAFAADRAACIDYPSGFVTIHNKAPNRFYIPSVKRDWIDNSQRENQDLQ